MIALAALTSLSNPADATSAPTLDHFECHVGPTVKLVVPLSLVGPLEQASSGRQVGTNLFARARS